MATTVSETQPVPDYTRFLHTLMNAHPYPHNLHHHPHHRWRFFSVSSRSFWTKYCLLCTICGSAATILAGIFLVVAALFRYYTTSINYFETVPTYIPAILLSICGVSTIAFSCKRNRNIILELVKGLEEFCHAVTHCRLSMRKKFKRKFRTLSLRITVCWSLVSAALSSVITITTSLIHMNRLQTLRECVYNGKPNPPSCTCIAHTLNIDSIGYEPVHYVFENTPDCDVIHGTLYSCLRAVFAISVVAVLLSIFLTMLLYQLICHERKKAYWSRIRRINSDWSTDFIACLARPVPRERSSMLPLVMSPTTISLPVSMTGPPMISPQGLYGWGPPPPYEDLCPGDDDLHLPAANSGSANLPSSATFVAVPPQPLSNNNNSKPQDSNTSEFPIISAHPFSPTITSMDPHFDQLNHLPILDSNNFSNNQNDTTAANEENASHLLQIQLAPPNPTLPRSSNCETVISPSGINGGEQIESCSCDRNTEDENYSGTSGSNLEDVDGHGLKTTTRISKNFSLHNISSLPNSPILKNVRKFCSFRLGEQKQAKVFSSNAKLNSIVSSLPGVGEGNQGVYSHQSVDGMNFPSHYVSEDRKTFPCTEEEIESL